LTPALGRLATCVILTLALLFLACGHADDTPDEIGTPTPVVEESPTPEPTDEPAGNGPSLVRANVQARCRLFFTGAELVLTYGARAEGEARLSRVRLLLDGSTYEESGSLNQRSFERTSRIPVGPGSEHRFQVVAEGAGAANASVRGNVRCPSPPGPRA
jgi:hypothetical protein